MTKARILATPHLNDKRYTKSKLLENHLDLSENFQRFFSNLSNTENN